MRAPFTQLYAHLVWSTWNRVPTITSEAQSLVTAIALSKCEKLKCQPIAIGGMDDHVHFLIRLHPAIAIATFVGEIKGASSHLINQRIRLPEKFRWQGAYGAFTLRKDEVEQVSNYVHNQKIHHQENTLIPLLEQTDIEA